MKHMTTFRMYCSEHQKIQSQSLCLGFTFRVAMEGKGEKGEVDKLKGALNGRPMPVTWLNGISKIIQNQGSKTVETIRKNPRMSVGNASWEIWRQLNYQAVL